MSRTINQVDSDEELKIAFRVFDKNDQGDIPADELKNIFEYLSKEKLLGITQDEIREMVKGWDTDGDGDVDYDGEFISNLNNSLCQLFKSVIF